MYLQSFTILPETTVSPFEHGKTGGTDNAQLMTSPLARLALVYSVSFVSTLLIIGISYLNSSRRIF